MKKLSCHYLQKAIYFAPDELRHCCQRFYVDGKMEGDVRIFPVDNPEDVNWDRIVEAKQELVDQINAGERTGCYGCPELEYREWPEVAEEQIDVISIEHHSRCNMRCTYCSDIYYGGKVADYDLVEFLKSLVDDDHISPDLHIAWGGGEPTMAKDFGVLLEFINGTIKPKSQRFFSNAINYDERIADLMAEGRGSMVTSIDAGTIETFRKVRGVNQLEKVLRHLKQYFDQSPQNLVIKYILTDENHALEELNGFVSNIQKSGIVGGNFLLSSDYKNEIIPVRQILSLVYLHFKLLETGAATCAFDEHVRGRIREVAELFKDGNIDASLPAELQDVAAEMVNQTEYGGREIVVWGAGTYSNTLLDNSFALKDVKVSYFVDSNPQKQGGKHRGVEVFSPDKILTTDMPILISASFHYHEIYEQLVGMGVNTSRILPNTLI